MKNLYKNKKGLMFKNAIFAMVIISMVVYAIGIWINDWNSQYNSGLNYDLGGYNKLDELSTYASSSKGNLSTKTSLDTGDFEGTSLKGAFSIINNFFTPFNVVLGKGGLLNSIQDRWSIPSYIILTFMTLFTIAIIMAIIAILTKRVQTTT
jgi:hypothetical protein